MKVTGFSFVKNALLYEYPVVESIRSILPLCDEFVIAVGKSDDGTLQLIEQMTEEKIRIVETVWNEELKKGHVLAEETDKAFKHISEDTDWAFYIQADEVLHEDYLEVVRKNMLAYKDNDLVDGLLFNYRHFYGSFDYVGTSSDWYPHEIRVVKKKKDIYSYIDAQGFRKGDDEKLCVVPVEAFIHHYGWVRSPEKMLKKILRFGKIYHGETTSDTPSTAHFDYERHVNEIRPFEGSHPKVMQEHIAKNNRAFNYDISMSRKSIKDLAKNFLKKYLGLDTYYRNYKILNQKDAVVPKK